MRILAAGEPIPLDKLGLPGNLKRLKKRSQALRPVLRLRPDRLRQDHHAAFGARLPQHARYQDLDRRRSGRNHPEGPAPGADEPKAGLDFATIMRAFLRADPDIIMVGEMRDKETVAIGIEASLTGHLVFATLHTNSAPESDHPPARHGHGPVQLRRCPAGHAGAAPGQAAVRASASRRTSPTPEEIKASAEYCDRAEAHRVLQAGPQGRVRIALPRMDPDYANDKGQFTLYRPRAATCCNTGYKGRVGLHELLVGSDTIKKHIQEHAASPRCLRRRWNEGMRTLKQDGIEKVLQGHHRHEAGARGLHQVTARDGEITMSSSLNASIWSSAG
jgi:hypothetical protein